MQGIDSIASCHPDRFLTILQLRLKDWCLVRYKGINRRAAFELKFKPL